MQQVQEALASTLDDDEVVVGDGDSCPGLNPQFDETQALELRRRGAPGGLRLFIHGSRVLVKRLKEEQSPGGIYLDPSQQDHATMGEVIATGPEAAILRVGDVVLFGRFSGDPVSPATTLDIAGGLRDAYIMEEEDVLGHFREIKE